jgi:hypothetical protein
MAAAVQTLQESGEAGADQPAGDVEVEAFSARQ